MINRRRLLALLGLAPAFPAAAALPPTVVESMKPTFRDFVNTIRPERILGLVSWADVDGADAYNVTVTDQLTGEFQIWRVNSHGGHLHTLSFSASRNRIYKVKVEAIYPDGSRRNAEQYDIDFAA